MSALYKAECDDGDKSVVLWWHDEQNSCPERVETPQGTPSPPEITSTVARPLLKRPKSVVSDASPDETFGSNDFNGSYVSSGRKSYLKNTSRSRHSTKPVMPPIHEDSSSSDAKSSLGILTVSLLQNMTTDDVRAAIALDQELFPDTDHQAPYEAPGVEPQITASQETETGDLVDFTTNFSSALALKYIQPMPQLKSHVVQSVSRFFDTTREECPSVSGIETLVQSSLEKEQERSRDNTDGVLTSLCESLPPQNLSGSAAELEEFESMTLQDLKAFMDNEERENEKSYGLMLPDKGVESHPSSTTECSETNADSEPLSKSGNSPQSYSGYFRACTSKIGNSLDHSLSDHERPNFGFEHLIRSPVNDKIANISPAAQPQSEEGLLSILEQTTHRSCKQPKIDSEKDLHLDSISNILDQFIPDGTNVRDYALKIMEAAKCKNPAGTTQGSLDEETFIMPSFISDTSTADTKENLPPAVKPATILMPKRASFGLRHSSPIKGHNGSGVSSKQAVKVSQTDKSVPFNRSSVLFNMNRAMSSTIGSASFPVLSDKNAITYYGSSIETIKLKSGLSGQELKLTLVIRDSKSFAFTLNDAQIIHLTLLPQEAKQISIKCTPTTSGWSLGKLILKPRGLAKTKQMTSIKATIQLQAFNEQSPQLNVKSDFLVPCDTNPSSFPVLSLPADNSKVCLNMSVCPRSDACVYVKVVQFCSHCPEERRAIDAFVLTSGQSRQAMISSQHLCCSKNAQLILFYGSEMLRQIAKHFKSEEAREFIGPVHNEPVSMLNENMKHQLMAADAALFLRNLQRQVISLHLSNAEFFSLLPEETFASLCASLPISEPRHRVYLEQDVVHFPDIKDADSFSLAKVTVRNRTHSAQRFMVKELSPPFFNHHRQVEVKPFYYLNIPIRFQPSASASVGCYQTAFCLINVDTKDTFTTQLVANVKSTS